jgi:Uma2 family endonuclease
MATQVLMSLEEFHALPEKKGIEYQLLRGRLIEMSAPTVEHGEIEVNFGWQLRSYVAQAAIDYIVASNTGFLLSPETKLVPDVCVLPRAKADSLEIVRGALQGAPDLAIEIVSPSDSGLELDEKVAEYLAAGTQIVWVAYPPTRHGVAHYATGEIRNFTTDQILDAGDVLPGLQIPVKDIFPARRQGRS